MRDNGDLRVEVGLFRELLRVTGTSFREIGEKVGVSHTTVARWASGEFDASVAQMQTVVAYLKDEPSALRDRAAVISHLVGVLGDQLREIRESLRQLQQLRQRLGVAAAPSTIRQLRHRWNRLRPEVAHEIFERDGHRCLRCGSTEQLTIDHIVPLAAGGSNDPENLQVLCRSCNSTKGVSISRYIQ